MEFLVTIAHAIAGGVESPLQLTFQVSTSGVAESMGMEGQAFQVSTVEPKGARRAILPSQNLNKRIGLSFTDYVGIAHPNPKSFHRPWCT